MTPDLIPQPSLSVALWFASTRSAHPNADLAELLAVLRAEIACDEAAVALQRAAIRGSVVVGRAVQ